MRRDVAIVETLYRHITEVLCIKKVTVGYGGWYAIVTCELPQDEQYLRGRLADGWQGVGVVVKRKS